MNTNIKVIIAVNSGKGLRVIGICGQYAKMFDDEMDAYEYIEKHGLEKWASVRLINNEKYVDEKKTAHCL